MISLTKTTALETAEDAITVNVICPGYVLTAIVKENSQFNVKL